MKDSRDTLKRLAREAAKKVNAVDDLTEHERGLLMCVLAIREFGFALRASMDQDGQVFSGFDEGCIELLPGDEPWDCIEEFTECVLEGVGELDRFDPKAAEGRRFVAAWLADLDETARLTEDVPAADLQPAPHRPQ